MRKLLRLIYKLRLRRPYQQIDRLHYLKRLRKDRKHKDDEWLYSDKDINQFCDGEILICSTFLDSDVVFYCCPDSHIERHIIRHGLYTRHNLVFMSQFLSPGTLFIDIGANIGAYAIPVAKAFPNIQVHAYEPHPGALGRFKRNAALNNPHNLTVFNIGIAAQSGKLTFHGFDIKDYGISSFMAPKNSENKQYDIFPVDVKSLDEIYKETDQRISLIKIDVQGYEIEVLKGAQNLIAGQRPYIFLEHEDINFSPTEAIDIKKCLRDFFLEFGYSVFYLTRYDPNMLFPVCWERPLDGDLIAIPDYATPL